MAAFPTSPLGPPPRRGNFVTNVSTFFGFFRWAFMPLGLFALVAVGVHAAADTLDDRILWLLDHADALFDGLFARFEATQSLVHWVGIEQRTLFSRAVTLGWEIAADLAVALPLFGYREEDPKAKARALTLLPKTRTWRGLFKKLVARPTSMRLLRPLATLSLVLAGACAIARMVQGALYFSLREGVLGDDVAGPAARVAALGALFLVLATLGWRAVLRNLQHADAVSEEAAKNRFRAMTAGWLGSAVVAPLALAALIDASPLLSFFR
ncbi:MAG: hypothetical protein ACOZIN_21830 [Myxococcota bacterium]